MWRLAWLRLRSVLRHERVDDELRRELDLHFEQLVREGMDAGLTEVEARRHARLAFGSPDAVTEGCRDARRLRVLETLARDVRYAVRLLARSPGFTATALLSLALGIGVNTAVFSVVDAVLVRSLPVDRPRDLVFIQAAGTAGPSGAPPYPCFERLRAETTAFAGIAAFASDDLRLVVDGTVEQAFGQVASGNYFEILGVKATAGRVFTVADEALDPPVAVVGYGYAERRFGGAAHAIGRTIAFRDRLFTIVGVTPPDFWGLQPGRRVDVTLPITQDRAAMADPGNWWFDAVARLRAGATVEDATTQANTVFQSFMHGERRARPLDQGADGDLTRKYFDHIELDPAARGLDRLRMQYSMPLYALVVVSTLVLLIACTNLGSLLLVRGAARRHEFAIRLATGAGAGRLFSQLLTETLVLFAIAAAVAPLVAQFATRALTGFFAVGRNPIVLDIRFDWRLIAFAGALTLIAGLLTGVWPAMRAIRTDPQPAVKDGDGRVTGARGFGLTARLLVAGQVTLSVVLVVAAFLFVKTIVNLRAVNLGFRSAGVLTMSLDPSLSGPATTRSRSSSSRDATERQEFWRQVLERVRAMPGVRAASLSVLTPLSGRDTGRVVSIGGDEPRQSEDRIVHVNHVSPEYFGTFGIRLLAGRTFLERDGSTAPKVAVLNEAATRAYFGTRSPIGELLRFDDSDVYRVVGVVADAKHMSVRERVPRFVYVPLSQPLDTVRRTTLSIASDEPAATLARAVAREVRAIHASTLVSDVVGIEQQIDATLVSERLLSALASAFAALALGLSAIGLYGVLSYSVTRRLAEFGVRMALGASPARLAWTAGREIVVAVSMGLLVGLPLARASASTAGALLFGVAPSAPGIYGLSAVVLIAVSAAAALGPAWRASSIDPAQALRSE